MTLLTIGSTLSPVVQPVSFDPGTDKTLHVSLEVSSSSMVSYFVAIKTYPNPLQLPLLVAGSLVLMAGVSFFALQLFKRHSVKLP